MITLHILAAISADITSTYADVLSFGDATFVRPNGNGARFYYKTIKVSIFATGNYTLTGNSSINICGVLYYNNFNASNPTKNIFAGNYNTSASDRFIIYVWLQSPRTYSLVVTSHNSDNSGSFQITATGPVRASFDLLKSTTSMCTKNTYLS